MRQRAESSFKSFDGTKIFYQSWTTPSAVGTIVITHGQGEHSECYSRLIDGLSDSPWNFIAWDLRGHGRSEGQRGYASHFDDYCNDFKLFNELLMARSQSHSKKWVYLSHSMGGLIQTKTQLMHGLPAHEGQVLSAPIMGVAVAVPAIKDMGALLVNRIVPRFTMGNEIKNGDLTRDPDVIREFERDTLRHHKISAGVYLGMLESFPWVMERAPQIQAPVLLQISDRDPVVSTAKALELFDRLGSKDKFKNVYTGGKHESYNDIHRATVYEDLKHYLRRFEN